MAADPGLLLPRLNRFIADRPTPKQAAFLCLPHREALFGGAVGGGKSLALQMAALQYVDLPGYHALIVRKSTPMLTQPGGLITVVKERVVPLGARWNASESQLVFPSGSTLTFRHFDDASAEANFQGGEYHFIGVDEATDFTEDQVLFLSSRLRKSPTDPFPLRLRLTAYPYGPGKEWVHRRYVLEGRRFGRPFVESRLEDNPYLDTDLYDEWLRGLGHVRYQQLRRGNWTIREEGTLFKPAWFEGHYLQEAELPSRLSLCRAWDLGATEGGGDYTAGVLLGRSRDGLIYVLDVRRGRRSPLGVQRLIASTAERDRRWARARGDREPMIVMEQEPGASGKAVIDHYRRVVLPSYPLRGVSPSGDKVRRAEIVSARAEAGDVFVCRGPWVGELLDELAAFPLGSHDDQVDALSAAYAQLSARGQGLAPRPGGASRPSAWHLSSSTHGWARP